jgi:toxin ParE1/3/4
MQIRWSPDAATDLENIVDYIRVDNPSAAMRVGRSIHQRVRVLVDFPFGGRIGRVQGTREMPLPPLPFIAVYRVLADPDIIEVVNVIHGAQRWPPAD